MLKRIITYFAKAYNDEDYLTQQTAYALIFISLLGIILGALYLGSNFILKVTFVDPVNFLFSPLAFITFLFLSLILVSKKKLRFAGNFLITSLIITEIIVTFLSLSSGKSFIFSFSGTFYYMLMLLTLGFFFASNTVLTINVVLIIISTFFFLKVEKQYVDPETFNNLKVAANDYVTNLIAIYAMLIFSKKVIKIAIHSLHREKAEKEKQYQLLNEVLNKTTNTVSTLKKYGDNLVEISGEIADRAKNQAVTTEEVAASTEEINAAIENTSNMAQTTKEISKKSLENAYQGQKTLKSTVETFLEINKHVELITAIAEKTDILAINAAIEAAHAGEYGKGFAVVAQEIRKLSDLSKEASEKISRLSQKTREQAITTTEEFAMLVENIKLIVNNMEDIALASKEQLQSISQISESATELSAYAEGNSSIAEQLMITAKKLSELSTALEQTVKQKSID